MNRVVILFTGLLITVHLSAQQYPFVHYSPKDGLVNSRVKKAYQDSKGRMYFLTYGGLCVYDGARFRNYTTQNGLPINIINDVLEIGNDSLLVATNTAKINLLVNGRIGIFKPENSFTPLINQFYRHDDGRIYLSSDFGLYVLEKNKIHPLKISGLGSRDGQPNLGNISGIGNYLLISTNEMSFHKGLFLYDIKNNRICDSLVSIRAYLVGKDKKKRIWLSTSNQLLIADTAALKKGKLNLLPQDKGYRQTVNYSARNIAFGNNFAWLVCRDKEFRNSELQRINEDGNLFRVSLPGQISASYIQHIFIDRENNIWLSNDGEGVFKIVISRLQIIEKPFIESGEGQAGYVYYSNGVAWFSTLSRKLFRRTSGKPQAFTSNLGWSPHIFYEKENTLLAKDDHNIYKATLQPHAGIINFQKIISLHDSGYFGKKIFVDSRGAIIASQHSGVGVWVNNKLEHHRPIESKEFIEDLLVDKNNRLWVVKRSLGIDVYSFHPGDFSNYLRPAFQIPPAQLAGSVRSCVMDKKGLIWLGTRDNGLAGYAVTKNRLEKLYHFHTGNGLSDNFVTSLACDSMNNIVAGTQSGLDLIFASPDNSYRIENISRNSNLFAYINSTWTDAEHAYALTNSGVVLKVATTVVEEKNESPQLLLEELKVNTKTVQQQKKHFYHKENSLSFYVAAPSFIDEKHVRYTYLLQGSGNYHWSDTTAANSIINLTNLSHGNYVLYVKAFFPSDAYPPAEFNYPFEITPPWWQTRWFRVTAGLLIIGFLILFIRFYYRRKLEKQKVILEKRQAIEKERTRISIDMHDDLGAGLSRIKFLSQSLVNKRMEDEHTRISLEKITGYSDEMTEKMGEIVWALNEKNDTLADLIAYTRSYAMEYLGNHGIPCEADTPLHLPGTFIPGDTRRNTFLSVKECLHNIVKHANASRVRFSVQLNRGIEIIIHDNGKGIDWNNLRINSYGLENIRNRMMEMNGRAEFINEQGTKVILYIPLPV